MRRAMGKKKLDVMAKEREIFINGQVDEDGNIIVPGCVRNGIDEKSANKIFDEMAEFAKYAFNKSHAAAYAVVSYRTAYLKAYYKEELMAATLNSFLGNLDKIPVYINDCKKMNIEILPPDINKSETRFTVNDNKIRFGMGTIKNVGIAAINSIVGERNQNGDYHNFTSFCERIKDKGINKKCVESLIKAGVFDSFGNTRATLLESFEGILDTINNEGRRAMENQVSMFDLMADNEEPVETKKYIFIEKPEFEEKELLSLEKEMIGVYISGHPLEKYRDLIEKVANINTVGISKINQEMEEFGKVSEYHDNQTVKFAGIITKIKKKFTRNNTIMVFVTIEDLYGTAEIIVFDSVYHKSINSLIEENVVLVEGRLSIREDEPTKIVASKIADLTEESVKTQNTSSKINCISIKIDNLSEENKDKLRGAIKFFAGDRANVRIQIEQDGEIKPCGGIYMTNEILKQFEEIVGKENIELK